MKNRKEEKIKNNRNDELAETKIEELQEQIELLTQEKNEIFAKLQRVVADFDNYQKRAPKQIADSVRYEKEKIIKSFLPILDNFEHTLTGAESVQNIEILLEGIRIVYDQTCAVLKSFDVEKIDALGEKFNPSLHEAMMRKQDADYEDNIIIEEFQKGYKLGDRVIRPSRVIVNKLPEEERQQGESQHQETDEDIESED